MDNFLEINVKEQQILQLISNDCMTVKEISKRLFMSEATVRRKLIKLENQNLIIRTHGGAVLNLNQRIYKNIPLYLRTSQLNEEKKLIAAKAVKLISDGDVLFVDSSSTALYLLSYLRSLKNITVCTNSLKAAMILAEMEISCVFLGGNVIPNEQACNSEETAEMIQRINADLFFFSCDALSLDGVLSDNSKHSCYLRSKYMKNAEKSVLLIDNTKLDKKYHYTLCTLGDIDYCICDKALPQEVINKFSSVIFL